MNNKEIEQKVTDLLNANKIECKAYFLGAIKRDNWDCDSWSVTFSSPKNSAAFNFYTGTGHRDKKTGRANAPDRAGVLHNLVIDKQLADDTFEGFCDSLGYDTDSRKALEAYLQCQKNGADLARVFGGALIAELAELLQDY